MKVEVFEALLTGAEAPWRDGPVPADSLPHALYPRLSSSCLPRIQPGKGND